jgi:uncharacterized membrane protein YfcA
MNRRAALAGSLAGFANGVFGGGGGMVFLPVMMRQNTVEPRKLYPTCVAVIFPVCALSAAISLWQGEFSLSQSLPYLAGGALGGAVGGKLYGKVSVKLLRWLFAAFLIYGGGKYLL